MDSGEIDADDECIEILDAPYLCKERQAFAADERPYGTAACDDEKHAMKMKLAKARSCDGQPSDKPKSR